MKIITPQQKKEALKKRLNKVLSRLPEGYWISVFIHHFPEYAKRRTHLSNVIRGMSLDDIVISKLEDFAAILKPKRLLTKKQKAK